MPRILLALLLWLVAPAALAHAVLLESAPAADAELAVAPEAVVLHFSEPVVPVAIRLHDAAGAVLASEPVARDHSVTLPLPPLEDGSYILTWRVISADSHPVGASFRFAVGGPLDAAAAPEIAEADWRGAAALHRAAYLALMLLGAGSIGFYAVFGGPPSRSTVPLLVAAAALALCLVPMQGGLLLGLPPGDIPLRDLATAGLSMPVARFGLASAGLLLLAALLVRRRPGFAAVAALAAVATLGLSAMRRWRSRVGSPPPPWRSMPGSPPSGRARSCRCGRASRACPRARRRRCLRPSPAGQCPASRRS
jgi:copper transport protein